MESEFQNFYQKYCAINLQKFSKTKWLVVLFTKITNQVLVSFTWFIYKICYALLKVAWLRRRLLAAWHGPNHKKNESFNERNHDMLNGALEILKNFTLRIAIILFWKSASTYMNE